jgi:hypothetical protein
MKEMEKTEKAKIYLSYGYFIDSELVKNPPCPASLLPWKLS